MTLMYPNVWKKESSWGERAQRWLVMFSGRSVKHQGTLLEGQKHSQAPNYRPGGAPLFRARVTSLPWATVQNCPVGVLYEAPLTPSPIQTHNFNPPSPPLFHPPSLFHFIYVYSVYTGGTRCVYIRLHFLHESWCDDWLINWFHSWSWINKRRWWWNFLGRKVNKLRFSENANSPPPPKIKSGLGTANFRSVGWNEIKNGMK